MPSPHEPLSFGVIGIGRIGRRHALNLLRQIPNARLVCACSPAEADLAWAETELVPYGVKVYDSFEAMIEHPGLQAVVVSSLTRQHYAHTMASLKRGLHVLCEKPVCVGEEEVFSGFPLPYLLIPS
jgi:myo-inositol 2-dehydrogenase / D-chiro-inositol 1-dehydrogenase